MEWNLEWYIHILDFISMLDVCCKSLKMTAIVGWIGANISMLNGYVTLPTLRDACQIFAGKSSNFTWLPSIITTKKSTGVSHGDCGFILRVKSCPSSGSCRKVAGVGMQLELRLDGGKLCNGHHKMILELRWARQVLSSLQGFKPLCFLCSALFYLGKSSIEFTLIDLI